MYWLILFLPMASAFPKQVETFAKRCKNVTHSKLEFPGMLHTTTASECRVKCIETTYEASKYYQGSMLSYSGEPNLYNMDCWCTKGHYEYANMYGDVCSEQESMSSYALNVLKCPDGSVHASNTDCVECAPHTYIAHTDGSEYYATECKSCSFPDNEYQHEWGQTSCDMCADPLIFSTMANECTSPCLPGEYLDGSSCADCPVGYYQDEVGGVTCKSCEAGKYQNKTNQAVPCTDCEVGQYQNLSGKSNCHPCGIDTYAVGTGTVSCTDCDYPKFQDELGKTDCKGEVKSASENKGKLYLYCPSRCPHTPCAGDETCVDGACVKHTCFLNVKIENECLCFGSSCSTYCMDNGECVDVLDNPEFDDLEVAFE